MKFSIAFISMLVACLPLLLDISGYLMEGLLLYTSALIFPIDPIF